MALTRRAVLLTPALLAAAARTPPAFAASPSSPTPSVGEDGMHIQPFFQQTFLDLREDIAQAASEKKTLVVFWEQRGCPYCYEMHRVNLADPEILETLKTHFFPLQLNLYGSREVIDFDGQPFEERRLAERWRVNFTPTLCFFPPTADAALGRNGRDAEAWRLPGYFKPFHFHATLHYVKEAAYTKAPFQRWLSDYADELRRQGKPVKLW